MESGGTRRRREEKWRGKRRMEWVASSLQLDSEQSIQCYYNRSPPTRTPRKPVLDWTDTPANINGLVRFAGRPNLVTAHVPSPSVFTVLNLHSVLLVNFGQMKNNVWPDTWDDIDLKSHCSSSYTCVGAGQLQDEYGDWCLQPFGGGIIFLILAHPVHKMWIKQETNTLDLWNKLHFEKEKTESMHHV